MAQALVGEINIMRASRDGKRKNGEQKVRRGKGGDNHVHYSTTVPAVTGCVSSTGFSQPPTGMNESDEEGGKPCVSL